jgi:hypothetical protein
MSSKHDAGKGDVYRPVDKAKFAKNWDMIFKKKKPKKKPNTK